MGASTKRKFRLNRKDRLAVARSAVAQGGIAATSVKSLTLMMRNDRTDLGAGLQVHD